MSAPVSDDAADARERRLVDWAVLLTGSPREAVGLVENAIIQVLTARRRSIGADPDLAVYVSAASRYIRQEVRRRRWAAARQLLSPHYTPRAGDAMIWPEPVRAAASALGRLDPHERAAALLHIVGASPEHLAIALNLHPTDAAQCLRLAAVRLSNELGPVEDLVGLDEDTIAVTTVGAGTTPWDPR